MRSILTETRAILFDLSPTAIDCVYKDKKEGEKLVAMCMVAAKQFAPSVIYIDQCHKVFAGKKKKKKGEKKSKKKGADPYNPARIKKALLKWKAKWITDETRITVIGCSNEPEAGSKKDFKKFFDKTIYFPFPDYTTRRLMWKTYIENTINSDLLALPEGKQLNLNSMNGRALDEDTPFYKLPPEFPLSTLAHITEGYAAGSIKQTCENVLTEFRKGKLEVRPLTLSEFIGPLSRCACTDKEANDEFKKFTDLITGDKRRRDALEKELAGPDDEKDKKGAKGAKKSKKK